MGDCDVVAVETKRDLHEFVDLPYRLYRDHPYWVPPLRIAQKELFDTSKHPFYAHADLQCFLARRNGKAVGRIAAIYDRRFNAFHGGEFGFFGFFESINDERVAAALLDAAREWLRSRGARTIRGPVNPSTNYECGLLVDGFDSSPQIMMTYNPPYYPGLLETAGLRRAKDLFAYGSPVSGISGVKADRVAQRAMHTNDVTIRPIRMDALEAEVELVWDIYNSAWSRNWGFVPLTRDELLFMVREMKPILAPELVLLGEVRGRPAGFALALPNINEALKHAGGRLFPVGFAKLLYYKRFISGVRVLVLGVREEFRSAGIAAGLYSELLRQARRLGYKFCELSWVLEDNVLMNRSMAALGARRYKTYRIYEWN